MNKQTLPTFYKAIIIITFLIACFFFLRWFDGVAPKFEWQGEIIVCKQEDMNRSGWSGRILDKEKQDGISTYFLSCDDFMSNYTNYSGDDTYCEKNEEGASCYIKEKVRVQ